MPRENIMKTDDPESKFRPSVGWSKETGFVQLGIQVRDDQDTVVGLTFDDANTAADIGRAVVNRFGWPEPQKGEPVDLLLAMTDLGYEVLAMVVAARPYVERDGIWVDLNRGAINDLVRVLRRARDSAMGTDA